MPSDPSNEQGFKGKDVLGLFNDYQILSKKYDEMLRVSQQILSELSGDRDEARLSGFLSQKWEIGKSIEHLSQRIASRNIRSSASQKVVLDQAKKEIEKIRSKAERLWSIERRIRKLTENS